MSAIGKVTILLALIFASRTAADDTGDDDAPAIHQSVPDFINAVAGANFRVEWAAAPTETTLDSEITLSLKVIDAVNPHRVRRPDLAKHMAFKSRFREVANGNDPPATSDAKAVMFTYRLRARDLEVRDIPEVKIVYYSRANGKLEAKYLDPIPLTLRPTTSTPIPIKPINAPERFFQIPTDAELRTGNMGKPDWRWWLALVIGLAMLTASWVAIWRRINPDGVQLAKLRRNRAVRRALDGFASASTAADPAAVTAATMRTYLCERFGLIVLSTVPNDVETAMRSCHFPEERIQALVELVRKCDAARFAGPSGNSTVLVDQARELLLNWEEAA